MARNLSSMLQVNLTATPEGVKTVWADRKDKKPRDSFDSAINLSYYSETTDGVRRTFRTYSRYGLIGHNPRD